jgi:hypothetical protein
MVAVASQIAARVDASTTATPNPNRKSSVQDTAQRAALTANNAADGRTIEGNGVRALREILRASRCW